MATPAMAQEAPTLLNPVGATCVSSPFGPRAGQMHRGIDLPAPAGAWVRAAALPPQDGDAAGGGRARTA